MPSNALTPMTDAAVVSVMNDEPFPIGHLAIEPFDAVPADFARRLERRVAELEAGLRAASHALRSYQYGNSATDLAQDVADKADALLEAK